MWFVAHHAFCFFFLSRRRHTRLVSDWSSDVCSSDLCRKKAIDVLQPDFRHNGGVLETKFMAELAETFAIQYAPHQANAPVGTAIYAQLNSTCSNFLIQEHFEKFASPDWLQEVFPDCLIA